MLVLQLHKYDPPDNVDTFIRFHYILWDELDSTLSRVSIVIKLYVVFPCNILPKAYAYDVVYPHQTKDLYTLLELIKTIQWWVRSTTLGSFLSHIY